MRFRHPRTRLVTAGAALAVLTVSVPTAYAAFKDPPPALAQRSPAKVAAPSPRAHAYIETRLLFGTTRPGGGPAVSDRQFTAFVDQRVTPRFPEGLTVQSGRGQWRDRRGVIEHERSYELILFYPASQARSRGLLIEDIRRAYELRYEQEAVARLDEPTLADFR
jgi:hypothetical protein